MAKDQDRAWKKGRDNRWQDQIKVDQSKVLSGNEQKHDIPTTGFKPDVPVDTSTVEGDTVTGSYKLTGVKVGEDIPIDQSKVEEGGIFEVTGPEFTERDVRKFWRNNERITQVTEADFARIPKSIVYIAGPMRDLPDFNFPAFDEARDFVNKSYLGNYKAISPADMDREAGFELEDGAPVTKEFFQECMRRDLEVVTGAHAILLLKGWENSLGANNELLVARACGVRVWLAIYSLSGKLINFQVAPEWLRSPLIYGDNGRPETFGSQLNLPVSTSKWAADRLENMSDERTVEEVDQTLSLPPTAENLTYGRTAEAALSFLEESGKEKKDPSILEEANELIYGPRQESYGHPILDFTRSGRMWGAIIGELKPGEDVSPEKVGLCMVAVKISREVNRPKKDNRIDGAGYFGCVDRIQQYKEEHDDSPVS